MLLTWSSFRSPQSVLSIPECLCLPVCWFNLHSTIHACCGWQLILCVVQVTVLRAEAHKWLCDLSAQTFHSTRAQQIAWRLWLLWCTQAQQLSNPVSLHSSHQPASSKPPRTTKDQTVGPVLSSSCGGRGHQSCSALVRVGAIVREQLASGCLPVARRCGAGAAAVSQSKQSVD